jgi:phosphohistidine phosphatase
MKLCVIRHAEAVPLGAENASRDEDRYLTSAGHASCAALAEALLRVGARPTHILSSPLVRARQTAAGLAAAWGEPAPFFAESKMLAPGARKRPLAEELNALHADCLAVVGHNPDLSELVGWLIGSKYIGISLEKSGAALIEFDGPVAKSAGHLEWLITPAWI